MAAQSKKVQITLGLMTIPVRLEKATDDEKDGTKTVCAGSEDKPHPPALVKQSMGCTVCDIKHSSHWPFPRGTEQADGSIVVVSNEELRAAAGEPISKAITVRFHERADVFGKTVASDSVQNMSPDKGGEKPYAALFNALVKLPHLVAATTWAPSTKNALWVLEVVEQRLVVSKRCWPEDVRTPPVITPVEVPEVEQALFDQFVAAAVEPFKVEEYRDEARRGKADLIAARSGEAQPLATAPASAPVTSGDMLAALQASLKAMEPKKPARKAPAKKAAPRKRAAKKPAEPAA